MGAKISINIEAQDIRIVWQQTHQSTANSIMNKLKDQCSINYLEQDEHYILCINCHKQQLRTLSQKKRKQIFSNNKKQQLNNQIEISMNEYTNIKLSQDLQFIQCLNKILQCQIKLNVNNKLTKQEANRLLCMIKTPYTFQNICQLSKMNLINQNNVPQHIVHLNWPSQYLLITISQQLVIWRIENGQVKKKITSSSMGQKTISTILGFKIQNQSLENIAKSAFSSGNNCNVDLMVGDIYGDCKYNIELSKDIIASGMGKLGKGIVQSYDQLDIARSIITSFAVNIGNLVGLQLTKQSLNTALLLGDRLHLDTFYLLVQSILKVYMPTGLIGFSAQAPFLTALANLYE